MTALTVPGSSLTGRRSGLNVRLSCASSRIRRSSAGSVSWVSRSLDRGTQDDGERLEVPASGEDGWTAVELKYLTVPWSCRLDPNKNYRAEPILPRQSESRAEYPGTAVVHLA